jgi:LysM repeat protein
MSSIAATTFGGLGREVRRHPARRDVTRVATAPRLTRRGRLVITAAFLVVFMVVLTVFGARSAATGESGKPVPTHTVEVGQGDTLWGIASRVAAPGQVNDMVIQIEELNAMSGPELAVGQKIAVPVR